jgi:hypothetical protein
MRIGAISTISITQMSAPLKSGSAIIKEKESDMDKEDDTNVPERLQGIYESLPDDSISIIISRRSVDIDEEQEETKKSFIERVEISVIDNLTKEALEGPVFYLTHGLLDIIENSFDDVVEIGYCRAMYLLSENDSNTLNGSADILNFADYKKTNGK